LRDDGNARIELHQVIEDDCVPIAQAFANDPVLTEPVAHLDRTLRGLAVSAYGPYETPLVSLQHCSLRNCDNLPRASIETHGRKLAGENLELWIRKLGTQLHGAERPVDGRAGEVQTAAFCVRVAVREHQVHGALFISSAAQVLVLCFRQCKAHPDWMRLRDRREQAALRICSYEAALGVECTPGDAGNRRDH
jgi:hypothetical protein